MNLSINVNGSFVKSLLLSASDKIQIDTFQMLCPGANAKISFSINGAINENFYLDYITVNAKAPLTYSGDQYTFRFKDEAGSGNNIQFNLSGAQNAKLWDVTTIGAYKSSQIKITFSAMPLLPASLSSLRILKLLHLSL